MKPIPHTSGWPFIGNALDLLFNPVNYFIDSAAEHGPVFQATVMGSTMYFVVATRGLNLFNSDAEKGCPLTRKGMFPVFAKETFIDVFGLDGAEHKSLRKLLRLGYSRMIGAQFVSDMIVQTQRSVRDWKPETSISILQRGGELATRNIMRAITPIDFEPLVEPAVLTGGAVMNVTMGVSPAATLKFPKYAKNKKKMIDMIDDAIQRHRANEFAQDPRTSMIDALIQARGENGASLDDVAIRGAVMYSLAGSYVYLSRTIAFVLYHLLRDEALLTRVQDEVDTVMSGSLPTAQDLRQMPLMRSCMREALRLYPPVPAISMTTRREITIEGYTIPENANVAFASLPDHYNAAYFEHPFDFDPKRWFPENRRPRPPGSYGAFGLKGHTCLAAGLVEVVVMSTMVGILYEARIKLMRPSYRPKLMLNPLLGPAKGMPIQYIGLREASERHVRPEIMLSIDLENWLDEDTFDLGELDVSVIEVSAGQNVVVQGDEPEAFFVIVNGTADVLIEKDGSQDIVTSLLSGQSFGEVGIFKSIPRTATVRAQTDLTLLRIDRENFEDMVAGSDLIGTELGSLLYRRYIDQTLSQLLPGLSRKLREGGLRDFNVLTAAPGEEIITQGESADAFYVLAFGSAEVSVTGSHGSSKSMAILGAGTGFGEMGLVENRPRSATVTIIGQENAILLKMHRNRFIELLSESPEAFQDLSTLMRRRLMDNLDSIYQG